MLKTVDNIWMESEFLLFRDSGYFRVGGKTKQYRVSTKKNGIVLGWVHWYTQWRQFAFFPEPNTLLEQICLRDIADFVELKTKEYKEAGGWK